MEFKKYKLNEVLTLNPTLKLKKNTIAKKIAMENIKEYQKKIDSYTYSEFKSGSKFMNGDTLLARITPCLENGKTAYVDILDEDEIAFGSTEFFVLRPKDNLMDSHFLYYLMRTNELRSTIIKSMTGTSGRQRAQKESILEYEFCLPSLKIQTAIAKLLKNFDDKIETNKKIIANLEELSQTLFKRWFVDFEFPDENGNPYKSSGGEMIDSELGEIPLNWKCSKIKDINVIISDHVANGSFKSLKKNVQFTEDLNDKYAVFARNVDLKKGDNRFEKYVTKSSYEFLRKSHLHGHEVIISNVGDVGSVYLSPILNRPMVLGNNQIFINSDEKSLNYYFYLFFKSSIGKNLIDSITSGSVQMKFNKTDLRNSLIVFPCKNDMNNLITVIKKYIYSIENKKSENMELIQLRDTLLPKLMSGEIEIPDDIEVMEDELSI
ncbi:TPA: restriction endonuclease subunit S [Staphylococcus aureus]|uniref:restriction endonuclease subunit S n=2 Tax=Staphylococcus TaxID=1279 RepID=UPI00289F5A4B|nr:restriction endonuclease subunit S [Staphylococcus aureus]HDJ6518458.1 restriction endonuclease subunit S [Staphylococcus aureus]